MDEKQHLPSVKTRMEVVELPSLTDQLDGIGQDLVRSTRLALVSTVGFAVHFRHDGIDMVVWHAEKDVYKPLGGASMALLDTN